jgi:O-antigen/teichoic acid export membrane protein
VSRTARAARTLASATALSALTMLVGFVSTPLLVAWLGGERFGVYNGLTGWLAYLSLLELGVVAALRPVYVRTLAAGGTGEVGEGVAAGLQLYAVIVAVSAVAGVALVVAMPTLLQTETVPAGEVRAATAVALLAVALSPTAVLGALVESRQRGYLLNAALAGKSLTTTGLALVLAYQGHGLPGQAAAVVAGAVVYAAALLAVEWPATARAVRHVGRLAALRPLRRELLRLNFPILVRQIGVRVGVLSDGLIVAAFLGAAELTPFVLTLRLPQLLGGQMGAVSTATWAALAELHAVGRLDVFNARVIRLTGLVTVVGVAVLMPAAAYNGPFVALWVGEDAYGGHLLTAVGAANALLGSIIVVWEWCFGGTGRVGQLVPVTVVALVLNLAVSLLATPLLGLLGPPLGTLVALAACNLWYLPLLLRREFGTPVRPLLAAVLRPLVVALPYGLGLGLLAAAVPAYDPGWPGWLKWAALAGWLAAGAGGYLVLAWFLALPADDRAEWLGRIRGVVGRRPPADPTAGSAGL